MEVFIPGLGWRALDPTHNCQINETYVKIGHGRDYADVPPVTGNYHGTLERTMEVEVKIKAIEGGTEDETKMHKSFSQSQSQA
jgi:transglutaminase-like putative cysteine protease